MPRRNLRAQREVVERCSSLAADVRTARERRGDRQQAVIEALWRSESLGTLLWALQLAELPAYDSLFSAQEIIAVDPRRGRLRDEEQIELARESARLWHWRARTAELQEKGTAQLPDQFATFDQLIAATAMRGYTRGMLPQPLRGDFSAYGKVYRHLTSGQLAEAHWIAVERHQALNWICTPDTGWDDVSLDT